MEQTTPSPSDRFLGLIKSILEITSKDKRHRPKRTLREHILAFCETVKDITEAEVMSEIDKLITATKEALTFLENEKGREKIDLIKTLCQGYQNQQETEDSAQKTLRHYFEALSKKLPEDLSYERIKEELEEMNFLALQMEEEFAPTPTKQ